MRVKDLDSSFRISWNENDRYDFARRWPGCDIPRRGWAIFDKRTGNLEDISDNTRKCELGGGMVEFLSDLKEKYNETQS